MTVLERLRTALAPGIAVEREIASGGMGIVLLGRDTLLDRTIAIKALRPELVTAISAERFLREARHAAALRHPNVVRVHHAGEADGLPYYTMDYIAGETLASRLAAGKLPPRDAVRVALDLLAALAAAHRHKLIHRDVKPSNIFLARGRALLGDFGVAHALDATSTALTQPGNPVGTIAYMAPEQLWEQPVTERTDIYAAGLVLYEATTGTRWQTLTDPANGDWSAVPRHLRSPIRQALRLEPAQRWSGADAFAEALVTAERRWRGRLLVAAGVATSAAGLLLATRGPGPGPETRPGLTRDLAVFPFTTAGLADSTLGLRLAGLTGWALEQVEGLTLTPRLLALRAWRGSDLPPARRLAALTGEATGTRYGAWAIVRPRGDSLEVQLRVVRESGEPAYEGMLVGPSADPAALGDSMARVIVRAIYSSIDHNVRKADALASVRPEAVQHFLLGEEAFARDAYVTAERHYARAVQLDSTFVLAGWRLGNARRWLPLRTDAPYPPGLFELFERNRNAVPPPDRYLLEAQFQPSGPPRYRRYEQALLTAGDDPYPALLYGDEVFHRGPLAGRPMREAVELLRRAVATDSTLAPAWEHLAWALIRMGDGAGAGHALAQLERWAGHDEESDIQLPVFLRMAHAFRFGNPAARGEAMGALSGSPEALALAARGALSFDLPDAQAALGGALSASRAPVKLRASGFVACAVALVALGRPGAALPLFDSAAALLPDPAEARLQAAEWRVLPPALGAPGWSGSERERGRRRLRAVAADSSFGARASWALAMDAHARGDSAEARQWAGRVRASRMRALVPLLDGMEAAARGDAPAALAASEPALAYDSAGHAPDPFLRAALHLKRGEWHRQSNRPPDADRAWLWYENLDLRNWPDAEAQPAEVDWALASHARALRARLALERGDSAEGCALARRVAEVWREAEPAVAAERTELAALAGACSS